LDLALLNCNAERSAVDAQKIGRLSEIHPSLRLSRFGGTPGDLVVGAQRGNAFLRPPIAAPRSQATSREDTGNQFSPHAGRQR